MLLRHYNMILSLIFFVGLSPFSQGALSRDSLDFVKAGLYGLYTSSDPTCVSNLVPTLPIQSTPIEIDMTRDPNLGEGPLANPVKCVVLILRNRIEIAWKSGDYTTSTTANGNTNADSTCNVAGSTNVYICSQASQNVQFPTQIANDMGARGLGALITSCPAGPTGSEIVPVFISTFSKCTGDTSSDSQDCQSGGSTTTNSFMAPVGSASTSRGIKLDESLLQNISDRYKLVMDFDRTFGATLDSGIVACRSLGPPKFRFEPVQQAR